MPEGALSVAQMGPRQGKASARHRRGHHLQGIRILHDRLSKRFLQGSSEKGVAIETCSSWRQIRRGKGISKTFFGRGEQASEEKIHERIRCVMLDRSAAHR